MRTMPSHPLYIVARSNNGALNSQRPCIRYGVESLVIADLLHSTKKRTLCVLPLDNKTNLVGDVVVVVHVTYPLSWLAAIFSPRETCTWWPRWWCTAKETDGLGIGLLPPLLLLLLLHERVCFCFFFVLSSWQPCRLSSSPVDRFIYDHRWLYFTRIACLSSLSIPCSYIDPLPSLTPVPLTFSPSLFKLPPHQLQRKMPLEEERENLYIDLATFVSSIEGERWRITIHW